MTNPFQSRSPDLGGPATDIVPVMPSDTVDLTDIALALYVEHGGIITFVTERSQTRVIEVTDFAILPVATRRVNATGTTATGIHALVIT